MVMGWFMETNPQTQNVPESCVHGECTRMTLKNVWKGLRRSKTMTRGVWYFVPLLPVRSHDAPAAAQRSQYRLLKLNLSTIPSTTAKVWEEEPQHGHLCELGEEVLACGRPPLNEGESVAELSSIGVLVGL